MKVSVIVAAAGRGERFGGKQNKILAKVAGRPMFLLTLELFANRDDVCQVILVVNGDDEALIKERFGSNLGFMGVQVVTGGAARTESIRNALALVNEEADLVAVHDAVRPCVSQLWLDSVFAEADRTGAAILAYPLHGTLKKVQTSTRTAGGAQATLGGEPVPGMDAKAKKVYQITETVCRDGLWEAQTPQVFRREVLTAAYEQATEAATDDAALVEASGHAVHIVMGDPRNIKVTTRGDLALAAAVIGTLPKPKPKRDGNPFGEAQW